MRKRKGNVYHFPPGSHVKRLSLHAAFIRHLRYAGCMEDSKYMSCDPSSQRRNKQLERIKVAHMKP